MITGIAELFRYDDWANRRVLEALKQPQTTARAIELFAHILAAQEIWLARLQGRDTSQIKVWPARTVDDCAETGQRVAREISAYLQSLGDAALEQPVDYRTTEGKPFRNTPRQILTHVAFHGQHHRGQISSLLREAGAKPAATDLIVHYRESR